MRSEAGVDGPYSRRLRQLHLALVILISGLAFTGFFFYFRKPLGFGEFKLEIMLIHALIGYTLIAALCWRLFIAFNGPESGKFRHVVVRPRDMRRLIAAGKGDRSRFKFAGRSPLSRLIASFLYAVFAVNIVSGMVFASTDLFLPPFGGIVLEYVTPAGEKPSIEAVRAGNADQEKAAAVRKFKRPFAKIHFYGALTIVTTALFHAVGALLTEWSTPIDKEARGRARIMLLGPRRAR